MRLPRLWTLVAAALLAAGGLWLGPSSASDGTLLPTAPATPGATTGITLPPLLPALPPPTTAAPATVPPSGLGPGDRGPQVAELERALSALRYDTGGADDLYDATTAHAVVAFQKITGLPRTGRATQDVMDHLATAQPPPPLVPGGGPTRVEVDLGRQVLLLYEGDVLFRVLPVSTGSGKRFCDGGHCRNAVTPPGSFTVSQKIAGWRTSDLGRLHNPVYFNRGIAIHGYPSVPAEPASHGCVRIPMAASGWFFDRVPLGTPVYVVARS